MTLDLAATLRTAAPESLRRPSAAEQVAGVLRVQIIDGHLRAGTHLVEETISDTLGFARNTIRTASPRPLGAVNVTLTALRTGT